MKDNSGRYGEDFSKPPAKQPNESPQAYQQRLKEWQRRRSMSGSKVQTGKKDSAPAKKKESSGGYLDKLLRGLKGES